jgi:hypothetical protein
MKKSPKKYRVNHNIRRIKTNFSYTLDEVSEVLNIHKQTLYTWIKKGLKTIQGSYPNLIHGSDLISFISKKQSKRKHKCKDDEMFCFKCKAPRKSVKDAVKITSKKSTCLNLLGKCEVCEGIIYKNISTKNIGKYQNIFPSLKQEQLRLIGI